MLFRSFETNLSSSQKEEMAAQEAFEQLKAAKEAEIKAGTEQRDAKTQELANTDSKLAQDKEDLEDTRNSLSADQKFLMNLKETCQNTDQEWEERQKARQEEVVAVGEALAILSSDDAHDTFTSTFNFVQKSATESKRDQAAKVLFTAAKKYGNPKLAAIASSMRLDAFTKVKAAIDEMINALLKEKEDEIKHKDFCTDAINKNERAQELKARDISELEAKIADLTSNIDELTKAIATLESEIAEMNTQLKRAGEDRELENKDFQQTVSDQRSTQALLNKALGVLEAVYAKKESLIQKQEPAGPPPPPGFSEYKKNSGASGVTTMIQNAATARAENGAQAQRLNWSSDMLAVNYTNVEAAHSRLSDVDFATESTKFAKGNILVQSAAAMLSQANSLPSVALQLLQ